MAKSKNPHAVAMGKLGGRKGGLARAANLSKEALSRIGRHGASIRWKQRPKSA